MSFHLVGPRSNVCTIFSDSGNFSVAPAEIRDSSFSVFVNHAVVKFTFVLSASQVHVIKKRSWFLQINVFHQVLPHEIEILLLSSHFDVIHAHRQD